MHQKPHELYEEPHPTGHLMPTGGLLPRTHVCDGFGPGIDRAHTCPKPAPPCAIDLEPSAQQEFKTVSARLSICSDLGKAAGSKSRPRGGRPLTPPSPTAGPVVGNDLMLETIRSNETTNLLFSQIL